MLTDPRPTLQPEEKLLLALCRLEFSEEKKKTIKDLIKEVSDWEAFVKLTNRHGIIALTAYNIKELGLAGRIPGIVMQTLDNGRMKVMLRNTWLVRRWKEINAILTDAGIKHLLLKGMALEHTVYGAKGLRQMTDNDILVRKEDALQAWNLLQEHGFIPETLKSPLYRKIIPDIGKHLPTLVKDGYAVEVHNRLFSETDKNLILDEAIDNAAGIEIEGIKTYTLNNNLHLKYLIAHNLEHVSASGTELKLFLDISLLKQDNYCSIREDILSDPEKFKIPDYRKKLYSQQFYSLPKNSRMRFLAGDIFPSISWMKERHGCGWPWVLVYYPWRMGKLFWLINAGRSKEIKM